MGGDLADYVDPNNVTDGLEKLVRYLDDPGLRRRREREIAGHFEPRSWRNVANDFPGIYSDAGASGSQPWKAQRRSSCRETAFSKSVATRRNS